MKRIVNKTKMIMVELNDINIDSIMRSETIIAYRCKSNIMKYAVSVLKLTGRGLYGFKVMSLLNSSLSHVSSSIRGSIESAMESEELFMFDSYDKLMEAILHNKI